MYQFRKQLGFALPLVILIAVILVIAGGAGYYFYKTSQEQEEAEVVKPEQVVNETADWKVYQNEEYGFEFLYPPIYDTQEDEFCRLMQSEETITIRGLEYDVGSRVNVGSRVSLSIDYVRGLDLAKYIEYTYESVKEVYDYFKIESKKTITIGGKKAVKISYKLRGPMPISDEENGDLINPKVRIAYVVQYSPAVLAGLKMGDFIRELKFKDEKLQPTKVGEAQEFINLHKDKTLTLMIERGKKIFAVSITPRLSFPMGEGPMGAGLIRTAIKDGYGIDTFLLKDEKVFIFRFSGGDFNCDYKLGGISEFDVYNQILSTFKFIK